MFSGVVNYVSNWFSASSSLESVSEAEKRPVRRRKRLNGQDNDNKENEDQQDEKKEFNDDYISLQYKLRLRSKIQSSYGYAELREIFKTNIQKWANQEVMPGTLAEKEFQVYQWGQQFKFGHRSIVIGCNDKYDRYGFITMELFVDPKENIYPNTSFIELSEGKNKYILNNKWSLQIPNIYTTLDELTELTFNLIDYHGKYSELFNNCQNFVNAFIKQCNKYNDEMNGNNSGITGASKKLMNLSRLGSIDDSKNDVTNLSMAGGGLSGVGVGYSMAGAGAGGAMVMGGSVGVAASAAVVVGGHEINKRKRERKKQDKMKDL